MSTTRFLTSNQAITFGSILNGLGGGAPALHEASGFPMSNVLTQDRYTIWKTPNPPTFPVYLDIDLGANRQVNTVGLHGLRATGVSLFFCTIQYATTYPPGAWSTIASLGITGVPRDVGAVNGSTVFARYWRFEFSGSHSGSGVFSLGKVSLGILQNTNLVYSPNSRFTNLRHRTEAMTPSGQLVVNDIGDPGNLFSLNYDSITGAQLGTIQNIAAQPGSFIYINENGTFYEVIVQNGTFEYSRRFNDLYSTSLELQRLP